MEDKTMKTSDKDNFSVFSELAEANRILTGIESWTGQLSRPPCYMITSAMGGEGKTVLTASLGMAIAQHSKKRVLAIDMNWYKPGLGDFFDLESEWRLSDHDKQTPVAHLIKPSAIPKLDILTAPADNTAGMASADISAMAVDMVNEVRDLYDFVLVDTGSLFPTNRQMLDPVVVGAMADATILVTLTNVTPRQQVKRAHMMLESAGSNVAGMVVNDFKNTP